MVDTFTPYAPNGTTTTDADGFKVPGFDTHTATDGKIQSRSGGLGAGDTVSRRITIGGVARPVLEGALHIPVSAEVPVAGEQRGIGWEYVCTAIGPDSDPALLGRRWLIVSVPAETNATARRLDIVEV